MKNLLFLYFFSLILVIPLMAPLVEAPNSFYSTPSTPTSELRKFQEDTSISMDSGENIELKSVSSDTLTHQVLDHDATPRHTSASSESNASSDSVIDLSVLFRDVPNDVPMSDSEDDPDETTPFRLPVSQLKNTENLDETASHTNNGCVIQKWHYCLFGAFIPTVALFSCIIACIVAGDNPAMSVERPGHQIDGPYREAMCSAPFLRHLCMEPR
jgi:hypothetical protein